MARRFSIFLFSLLLLGGLAGIFILRVMPPAVPWAWCGPALLTAAGALGLGRSLGWRLALLCVVSGGALVVAAGLIIWPPAGNGRPLPAARPGAGALVAVALHIPPNLPPGPKPVGRQLLAPEGVTVAVFAAGLQGPRMLAFDPGGNLYVSQPRAGTVAVLPDRDRDGVADSVRTFAAGLDRPHGLAFAGRDLVVAEHGHLTRLIDDDRDLQAEAREVLSEDLPTGGGHWTRSVVRAPDGSFFVAAGSSCNVCIEKDPRRAAILKIPVAGGTGRVFARGLRNSVGLAFHPVTGELWASDNGRDMLGDNLPPEEINRILAGGDYGWPHCCLIN